MNSSELVSIDIENLADTLSEKFKSLHPLSEDCCIYRVPHPKRCLHPSHYTPRMVSIGPFHHGNKEELKAMEEHKIRYMQHFLQRTKVRLASFLALVKEKEVELRNCYAETIDLESDEFVTIILVDTLFLIEYILRNSKPDYFTNNDDRIFRKPWLSKSVQYDLLLLENQLPLFILNDLFKLAKTETYGDYYKEVSLIKIIHAFLSNTISSFLLIEENMLETQFSRAKHFVDLLILCLRPSQSYPQRKLKNQRIPRPMELHQSGVKFMPASSKNLLDITFKNGVLEIPFLMVYGSTERFLRNLLAYEIMHSDTRYVNDYIIIMAVLIDTHKDVEFLMQSGIIGVTRSERFLSTFRSLGKDCELNQNFHYYALAEDLLAYCKIPSHKWKANLAQNYFNTPWASISVVAGVILLVFTITQTVCALIAL